MQPLYHNEAQFR